MTKLVKVTIYLSEDLLLKIEERICQKRGEMLRAFEASNPRDWTILENGIRKLSISGFVRNLIERSLKNES